MTLAESNRRVPGLYVAVARRYCDIVNVNPSHLGGLSRDEWVHLLVFGADADACDTGAQWFRAAVNATLGLAVDVIREWAGDGDDVHAVTVRNVAAILPDLIERRQSDG
jgi:hypothetical protein